MVDGISYNLPVTIFREGKYFVAYSPALDLSSFGTSEEDAQQMFAEAVELFFEGLHELNTLEPALKDLGWTKVAGKLEPPEVVRQSLIHVMVPLPA